VVSAPAATPAPTTTAAATTSPTSIADYTTQRAKPLPANTATLRNDRSAMAGSKGERPARADRN
jgi:hypothetical protein